MEIQSHLSNIGLSPEQAQLYQTLLQHGTSRASLLSRLTGIKTGMTYKALDQLIEAGLVERDDTSAKTARFRPLHPQTLMQNIQTNEQKISQQKSTLEGILGDMVSQYNLLGGKPNVQFFEGPAGARQVLYETLKSTTTIYSFIDIGPLVASSSMQQGDSQYVSARLRKGIRKEILVLDHPAASNYYQGSHNALTEVRTLPTPANPLFLTLQAFDDKVMYITYKNDERISVLIHDPLLFGLIKHLFGLYWDMAKPLPDTPAEVVG